MPTLLCLASGIPVAWNSVGVSAHTPLWGRKLLALALREAQYVSVRDESSAKELSELAEVAHGVGADLEFNILSKNLFFLQNADIASMWPDRKGRSSISWNRHSSKHDNLGKGLDT